MSALIVDVLKVAGLGLALMFVWDVWQLVRKQSSALDRDQDILDQITVHEPADDAEVAGFAIDLDMNEADATLAFIEQFRAIKEQHGHNND